MASVGWRAHIALAATTEHIGVGRWYWCDVESARQLPITCFRVCGAVWFWFVVQAALPFPRPR